MEIKQEHRTLFHEIVSKTDLKEYEYHIENGKVRLYINYYVGNDWIMDLSAENNGLCLNYYKFWLKFRSKFGLTYDEFKAITSALIEKYTKINGITTYFFLN